MKHKSGRVVRLILAVMLCMVLLPTTIFATTYIDRNDVVTDSIYILNDDMVINEGVTLRFFSKPAEFNIAEYTLTNYGTINGDNVNFVAGKGVFYNYGVYSFTSTQGIIYDLTLSSIALSSGTLSPGFAAGTRAYTVTVDYGVTSIDITPTVNTGTGVKSITVNGTAATSGAAATVSLDVGENSIPIVITADDWNNTTNTYTLTVTRSACTHASYDANGFCEACGAYQPATKNGSTYEISNAGQLFWFAAYVNGDTTHADISYTIWNKSANAVLTADIAIPAGYTWTPIGNYSSKTSLTYAGTFDGGGHTISGLSISTTSSYQGLFGYIAAGGTVKDVTVSGSITGGDYTGGVAGRNGGTISGCTNSCAVSGGSYVGGVAGYHASNATISGCTNAGTVTGSDKYVGGLTGYNNSAISNCTNAGAVTGSSDYVGGIIGRDIGTVTGCTNSGTISGASYVGGISGYKNQGSIYGCINSGTISGTGYVGGIAGYNSGGIKGSANTGAISGTSNVGGVVGQNKRGSIASCYSTDTSCGIAGSNNSTITNCYYLTASTSASANSDTLTAAQFASGEATYLLNGSSSQASDLIWYQTLGTDSYPVLSSTHGVVYYGINCQQAAVYSNTALSAGGHSLSYVEAKEATCTEAGNCEYYFCSICKSCFSDASAATEISAVIAANGHKTEIQNAKAATCTEDGYTGDEVCTVCNVTITAGEAIPATGHTTEIQNAKAATCTADGYTGDEVCTVCGETITAGETIPATGHSYTTEVIDPTYTKQGYTLHTCETCGDSYMDDYTDILVLDGKDSSVTTQTTIQSLTVLPDGLKGIYSSVDELIADLVSRVTVTAGYTEANTAVYDVYLQYSVDGGAWAAATVDNFPTTGITVTLPYPDGTDASYSFTVLHMFTETSSRLGITAGETESPTVTKTDDGLVVTLTGLSPVAISWQAPTTTTTTTTTSAKTGDSSNIGLWIGLLAMSGVGIVGLTIYCTKRRRSR